VNDLQIFMDVRIAAELIVPAASSSTPARGEDAFACVSPCPCSRAEDYLLPVPDDDGGHAHARIGGLGAGDGMQDAAGPRGSTGQWRFNGKEADRKDRRPMPCGMRGHWARTSPSFFRLQPLLRVTGVAYVWSVLDRQNLAPFAEDLGRLFRSLF
jgi:hypothetical protein